MDENERIRLEASFRKGYQQGYYKAVQDFQEILKSRLSPDDAIKLMIHFVENDLSTWRNGDYGLDQEPPELNCSE
jgi:hypothetical protein